MLTDEQLKARKGRVTSSVVSLIVGSNPWGDEEAAYKRIMGLSTFQGNAATKRGDMLEHVVLDYVCDQFPELHREDPAFVPKDDWAGDSMDALYLDGNRPVFGGEGKTVAGAGADKWGEPGTSQVPEYVKHQAMWHLFHWPQVDRIYVPVLFGGSRFEFQLYHVERRDSEIEALAKACYQWWERHIKHAVPPAGSTIRRSGEAGTAGGDRPIKPADSERINNLAHVYAQAKSQNEVSKSAMDVTRDEMLKALGTEDRVTTPIAKVIRSVRGAKPKVDWRAVAQELHAPDEVIERNTVPGKATEYVTVKLK